MTGGDATRLSSAARSASVGSMGRASTSCVPTRGNAYIGDVDGPEPMNPPPVLLPYTHSSALLRWGPAATRPPDGSRVEERGSSTLTPPGFLSAPLIGRPSDPEWNSGL